MGVIVRRPQFHQDIREVWTYIAKDNERQADIFVFELEKRYQTLSEKPALGSARFPNYPKVRVFPFQHYLIIYEPLADNGGTELIRLLHAAKDYSRYFKD